MDAFLETSQGKQPSGEWFGVQQCPHIARNGHGNEVWPPCRWCLTNGEIFSSVGLNLWMSFEYFSSQLMGWDGVESDLPPPTSLRLVSLDVPCEPTPV